MSTYLDQSSTNPDLSRTETTQAPTLEFELFSLEGGLPKHLDDEPLETRDVQPTTWTANLWQTRAGHPQTRWSTPEIKKFDFPPQGLSQHGGDAAERRACLGEADVDFLGAEISRHRPIQG